MAALIALIAARDNYLRAFSFWVFAYAAFAVLYAIIKRQQYSRDSITYWDEAAWLCMTALMLNLASKAAQAA